MSTTHPWGPFKYVEGLDAEVDFMTWEQYQAQQAAPRLSVELAECGHYKVIADGKSVDGEHYTSEAKAQSAQAALEVAA